MKIFIKSLPVLIAAFFFTTAPGLPVQAQALPPAMVGIVQMSVIVSQAKAYKQVRTEMDKRANAIKADAEAMEKDLAKQRDDLVRQKTLLSPEAFKQRQVEFQKKLMDLGKSFEVRQDKLRGASEKASQEIQVKLSEVSGAIAQERGLNLVITGNSVLFAIKGYDISDEVLKRLDEQLPKVAIPK